MKLSSTIAIIGLIFSLLYQPPPAPLAESPADLIAAINDYRTANGLHALNYDASLMVSAQAQADWMATTRIVSHVGPGGSSAKDRAIAAGYGGGSSVFGSEIIYGGSFATVDVAMSWWKQSPNHNPWMLFDGYVDIGAGIAYVPEDNYVYFAVTMFYKAGSAPPSPGYTLAPGVTAEPSVTPGPLIIPVIAVPEAEDGSITHIVRTGQSMWNIAAVYGVDLQRLYDLNGMTKWDVIYPGDEIIVKLPDNYLEPSATSAFTEIALAVESEAQSPETEIAKAPSNTPLMSPTASPTSRFTPTPTEPIYLEIYSGDMTELPGTIESQPESNKTIVILAIAGVSLLAIIVISYYKKPD